MVYLPFCVSLSLPHGWAKVCWPLSNPPIYLSLDLIHKSMFVAPKPTFNDCAISDHAYKLSSQKTDQTLVDERDLGNDEVIRTEYEVETIQVDQEE